MAKSTRIQVSFSEYDYDLIKRLADLQGVSMSAVVSDLFEPVRPVLHKVCVVLEAAKKAKQDAHEGIKFQVQHIEEQMQPMIDNALDQFDMFVGYVEAAVDPNWSEERSDRPNVSAAPKRPRKGAQPPHSNTGVRSRRAPILKVPKVVKKPSSSAVRKGASK